MTKRRRMNIYIGRSDAADSGLCRHDRRLGKIGISLHRAYIYGFGGRVISGGKHFDNIVIGPTIFVVGPIFKMKLIFFESYSVI